MPNTTFPDIQRILDDAVNGEEIGPPHGAFWRNVTRDEFIAIRVLNCPIINSENGKFVGPTSLLVTILKSNVSDCKQKQRPQMPFGFGPIAADKVQTISDWIDAQCPP